MRSRESRHGSSHSRYKPKVADRYYYMVAKAGRQLSGGLIDLIITAVCPSSAHERDMDLGTC